MLYEVNTRVVLHERGAELGRPATLDDLADAFLDDIAARGFDWVWMLGVWQTGAAGREVSATNRVWVADYHAALPDFVPDDVTGSPFAIVGYDVHRDFGGDDALARLRVRLADRGLRLMLDFVPNHTALDHPWLVGESDWFVGGTDADLAAAPQNYFRAGDRVVAHGRDPYFDGWPDTAQLDYRQADLRAAMSAELARVAERCDGVRCDMAMLLEPEVFATTWGEPHAAAFWPDAISAVRADHPGFVLMAEVYWGLEWQLQQHGFDLTYDKRLYDRLLDGDPLAVRGHLAADAGFQGRSVRFLENHDEPRAATAFPSAAAHEAAAIATYLGAGLRFFHEGQLDGRRVKVPVHLRRRPDEPPDPALVAFYERLLGVLADPVLRDGHWRLMSATHAGLLVAGWSDAVDTPLRWLVVVNLTGEHAQGRIPLPDGPVRLVDRMHDAADRAGTDELSLDLGPHGYHVFEVV